MSIKISLKYGNTGTIVYCNFIAHGWTLHQKLSRKICQYYIYYIYIYIRLYTFIYIDKFYSFFTLIHEVTTLLSKHRNTKIIIITSKTLTPRKVWVRVWHILVLHFQERFLFLLILLFLCVQFQYTPLILLFYWQQEITWFVCPRAKIPLLLTFVQR